MYPRSLWRAAAVLSAAGLVLATGGTGLAKPPAGGSHGGTGQAATIRQVATIRYPSPYQNPASFDISWVNPATQTYYLADRTNNAVDVVNASTDAFSGVIGAGDFSGAGAAATSAQKATCGPFGVGGPNGVLTLSVKGVSQLWAGDGVTGANAMSSVKVFDLSSPSTGTLAASISTGGTCRADELAYDPADHLVAIANDADVPPYVSFISVHANPVNDTVVKQVYFKSAIDGIEQTVWNPANDMFYINLPQVPTIDGSWMGQVVKVDPQTLSVAARFPVPGCSPAGLALDAPTQQLLLGCSSDALQGDTVNGTTYPGNPAESLIMSARSGQIVAKIPQVGGSDEVWLDPANRTYYLGASSMTSDGTASGYPTPALGVISAAGNRWVENFPTTASAHSVAVDPANGHVFVPIPKYGIAVFAPVSGTAQNGRQHGR